MPCPRGPDAKVVSDPTSAKVVSDPTNNNNLASLLVRSARRFPAFPAIAVGANTVHTYAELAMRVARLAAAMRVCGLAPGDRVALVAKNCPEYIEALFACWSAGCSAVPVNSKLHPNELGYILQDSGARWAFVDSAWHDALSSETASSARVERVIELGSAAYAHLLSAGTMEPPMPVATEDAAWLFYTSGTTGRPKGVVLSHGNLFAMSLCFLADVESVQPGDAVLHPAPLSHGSGLYVIPHVLSAAAHVIPESGGFDPDEILTALERWPGACFFAAPTMVKRLVGHRSVGHARLDHLKSIIYGGAPMYVEDCKAAFNVLGPRLAQIYGQGESPMTITAMNRPLLADAIVRGDDARIGSVGMAQPGIDVRIAARDDSPLPAGQIGEVLVRGPTVMQRYWRNPEASAAALANGWLHTGDVGCVDADGFLTLKDRSKDLIISGGSNIYPREVEEVLLQHAGVAEAAVVGRRHADWGEEVVAYVVARDAAPSSALEHELDALCLRKIARFKRPKAYVFVSELPKNNTGKVLKTVLRERLAAKANEAP